MSQNPRPINPATSSPATVRFLLTRREAASGPHPPGRPGRPASGTGGGTSGGIRPRSGSTSGSVPGGRVLTIRATVPGGPGSGEAAGVGCPSAMAHVDGGETHPARFGGGSDSRAVPSGGAGATGAEERLFAAIGRIAVHWSSVAASGPRRGGESVPTAGCTPATFCRWDADGYLRIVDRKKELIINQAGKNMSPANIETTILAACPMVVTRSDRRRPPLQHRIAGLRRRLGCRYRISSGSPTPLPRPAAHPQMLAQISAGVAEGNAKLSRVEQIKRFRVLPTLWEPGGDEITLTMKLYVGRSRPSTPGRSRSCTPANRARTYEPKRGSTAQLA